MWNCASPPSSCSTIAPSTPHSALAAADSPSELIGSLLGSPVYVCSAATSAVSTRSAPTSGSGNGPARTACGDKVRPALCSAASLALVTSDTSPLGSSSDSGTSSYGFPLSANP